MTDYTTYVSQLENMIAMDPADVDFPTIIPAIINYAEMRIYRELDLISTITRDTSVTMTAGSPNISLPNTFVVIQGINILPAGSSPATGSRTPLVPVSKEVVYALWGDPTATGVPSMYAMVDQWSTLIGPSPNADYVVESYGTIRPTPLSVSNPNTFLTTYLYDLFLAASMIFVSGWMRNFGALSSDPQMSSSWESQYQNLKASANIEELRKKSWSDAWTSFSPTPLAQPSRG